MRVWFLRKHLEPAPMQLAFDLPYRNLCEDVSHLAL
jgi:hypothetical protein